MILFICGTSSVGKSTVSRHLKKILPQSWLLFSMDGYLAMLGGEFENLHPDNPDVCIKNDVCYANKFDDGTYEIVPGPLCKKLFGTMPDVLRRLSDANFHIIVDALITKNEELVRFKQALKAYECKFIYLSASEDSIRKREDARGDRLKGSAIHWLRGFDFQDECDAVFDTDEISAEGIAEGIAESIS